ncbi:hypothetical protein QQZ08_000099 [Neonectria magnoliae]|uniref:Aminoglycoside phosphotransferase domain-containing protein n=1 Tax=Neonectria magnoliae TaxID=2732573 RepID=A0ABR1IHP5_9HYPO
MPAYFKYTEEKLLAEVAAMRCISDNTTIPLPFILHYGMKEESPGGLGSFIIMEWVENADPDIDEEKLRYTYNQMANVLLQLSKCKLAAIGSLGFQDDEDNPKITKLPLSLNIARLVNFARVPQFELPSSTMTFTSSPKYCSTLANMHLQQLSFQRNQAVDSADDCRKNEFNPGPFKLWCDDLPPANVLLDKDDKIAAVFDWEFTYTAPAEFSFSPPLVAPSQGS